MTVDQNPSDREAIRLFEAAAEREGHGDMSEALGLYRQAYKLNPKVDLVYRAEIPKRPSYQKRLDEEVIKKINVEQLIQSFHDIELKPAEISEDISEGESGDSLVNALVISPLMALPHDILLKVVEILMLTQPESWQALLMTCKKLAYMGLGTSEVWRKLCYLVYPEQVYEENAQQDQFVISSEDGVIENAGQLLPEQPEQVLAEQVLAEQVLAEQVLVEQVLVEEIEQEAQIVTSDELPIPLDQLKILPHYNSWKHMLSTRPFIKFIGCYISTVMYHSEGGKAEFSNSWNNPIRAVTYYRYLRFYPDGTAVKVLSALEPLGVVSHLLKFNSAKSIPEIGGGGGNRESHRIYHGTWTISSEGEIHLIINNGSVPYYVFHYYFKIKSVGKFKHNKLSWIRYFAVRKRMSEDDDREGEESLFTLKNEKPFKFLKVRSYKVDN